MTTPLMLRTSGGGEFRDSFLFRVFGRTMDEPGQVWEMGSELSTQSTEGQQPTHSHSHGHGDRRKRHSQDSQFSNHFKCQKLYRPGVFGGKVSPEKGIYGSVIFF